MCRLIQCNEVGKAELEQHIGTLNAGGGTNISQGLEMGIKTLGMRRVTNTVSSILLLSDGQDSQRNSAISRAGACYAEHSGLVPAGFTTHTFGYGSDHDADLMNFIAQTKDGDFHFVENDEVIPECFSDCLGGLISIVADEIHVSLEIEETVIPVEISKVFTDSQSVHFRMPQLFSGDTKDTVFMLKVPAYAGIVEQEITIAPVKVSCVYRMVKTGE